MSIKSLNDLKPQTITLPIKFPASDEIIYDDDGNEVKLHVGGFFTKQYKHEVMKFNLQKGDMQTEIDQNKSVEEQIEDLEQRAEDNAFILAATIVDWEPVEFWDPDGDGQFTVDKMKQILEDYDWLQTQLLEVLKDNKKFFRGSKGEANSSNSAQSKS